MVMPADWFIAWVSVGQNILVGLSALAAVVAGVWGLRSWKTELKGKTRYEVARRLALVAMKCRSEFHRARDPFTYQSEWTAREPREGETEAERQLRNEWYARSGRASALGDALVELMEARWEAEILLYEKAGELVSPFITLSRELNAAIGSYFQGKLRRARTGQGKPDLDDFYEQQFAKIYGVSSDEFGKRIDGAVDELVQALRRHIR